MIYDTKTWEYPYLYNLIDQYRHLEKYNNGYSYNMMFVGPGWLNKMGRWEAPYELLKKSYEDGMAYYGELKKEGKLVDMTMGSLLTSIEPTRPTRSLNVHFGRTSYMVPTSRFSGIVTLTCVLRLTWTRVVQLLIFVPMLPSLSGR